MAKIIYTNILGCVLFVGCTCVFASESKWYWTGQVGSGGLNIEKEFAFDGDTASQGYVDLGLGFGAVFSNLVFEFNYLSGNGWSYFGAFDEYDINQRQYLAGVAFPINDRFNLIPKIGFSDWNVRGEEGAFFNPGPEENSNFSGKDQVFELELDWKKSERFALGIVTSYIDSEIGKMRSTRLLIKISQ